MILLANAQYDAVRREAILDDSRGAMDKDSGEGEKERRGLEGVETNQIMAHPSASWKLKAISTPLPGSCHTLSVSVEPH
jgi:hypothetical protein